MKEDFSLKVGKWLVLWNVKLGLRFKVFFFLIIILEKEKMLSWLNGGFDYLLKRR